MFKGKRIKYCTPEFKVMVVETVRNDRLSYREAMSKFEIGAIKKVKGKCYSMAESLAHTKWMCNYHIVFTPKYRRKIIYNRLRTDIKNKAFLHITTK